MLWVAGGEDRRQLDDCEALGMPKRDASDARKLVVVEVQGLGHQRHVDDRSGCRRWSNEGDNGATEVRNLNHARQKAGNREGILL